MKMTTPSPSKEKANSVQKDGHSLFRAVESLLSLNDSSQVLTTTTTTKRRFSRRYSDEYFSQSFQEYIKDESFDILPKTDYTYSRSGSYQRSCLKKGYISPNMSRRRLHGSIVMSPDVSYSGSAVVDNTSYSDNRYVHQGFQKNIGQQTDETGFGQLDSENYYLLQRSDSSYSNQQDKRSFSHYTEETCFEEDLDGGTDDLSFQHQSNHQKRSRRVLYGKDGMVLRSGSHLKGIGSLIKDHNSRTRKSFSSSDAVYSNSHSEGTDYKKSGASTRKSSDVSTIKRTLVTDFEDAEVEKGSLEQSEKSLHLMGSISHLFGSWLSGQNSSTTTTTNSEINEYNTHTWLDSEEETSDVDTVDYDSYKSSSDSSVTDSDSFVSRNFTTTVVTTVTTVIETISMLTQPVVAPVWNAIGRPVINSVISGSQWAWSKMTSLMAYFVLLDIWLLARSRANHPWCCLCLPLLLLLPLLLFGALYGGQAVSRSSLLPFMWLQRNETSVHKVSHFDTINLSEHIQKIIVQLQQNQGPQLTASDVEKIVKGVLSQELAALRSDMVHQINIAKGDQASWQTDQRLKFSSLEEHLAAAVKKSESLEKDLTQAKLVANLQGEQLRNLTFDRIKELEDQLRVLNSDISHLQLTQLEMLASVKNCCRNDSFYAMGVRNQVNDILAQIVAGGGGGGENGDTYGGFAAWLHGNYVKQQDLDNRLTQLANEITQKILALTKSQSQVIIQSDGGQGSGLSEEYVRLIVEESLLKFSADRTGMADYALESAGGSVISIRCSETYYRKTALVSIFGIPLWYSSNSARTVIQPDVHPGQCWAFKGSYGYIVIQLATAVKPSGFTLEHIPKSLAPSGNIDSAPKDFAVFGLESEDDKVGVSLGNFTYSEDGKPIQYFPIQTGNPNFFQLVELRILSNHGNPEYTCLYRFRVHGMPYQQ